jgi:hypothetical protein
MTFVGKILVVVITILALFFLALSTVVFSTATNWKDEATKLKTRVTDLDNKLKSANETVEVAKKDLESAKAAHGAETKALRENVAGLEVANQQLQTDITTQRAAVAKAQELVRSEQEEAEARTKETGVLREALRSVQEQANQFKVSMTELRDRIRILERDLSTAVQNNKDLRDRVALLQGGLSMNGLSTDPATYKAVNNPPDVEGIVRRVNTRNNQVEISIGSDDGLVVGNELTIYRREPTQEYLAKIKLIAVDPDQAVGDVVGGKTYQGKKIQEGDIVATQIRSAR